VPRPEPGPDGKRVETEEHLRAKLIELYQNSPIKEAIKKFQISRIHRNGPIIGKERAVLLHVHWWGDLRQMVRHKSSLPDGIWLREDWPVEMQRRHDQLKPIMRAARKNNYGKRAYMDRDVLVVDDRRFTVAPFNNLHKLPADISPKAVTEKSTDVELHFFGRLHPLSNFADAPFHNKADGVYYSCSEQYIQRNKCLLFGDTIGASRVMNCQDPVQMKRIGSRVRGYEPKKWETNRDTIGLTANKLKFAQNNRLRQFLLQTGEKTLIESSPDRVWGSGVHLDQVGQKTPTGSNLQGKILMAIRSTIKP
jgi:ribA/ribD-fused uncharacterized protein